MIIAALTRSGSHLFMELMKAVGVNIHGLRPEATVPNQKLLSRIEKITQHGNGMIIREADFAAIIKYSKLRPPADIKWVWLRRGNKLDQALSLLRVKHLRHQAPDFARHDALKLTDPPEKHELHKKIICFDRLELYRHFCFYQIWDDTWAGFFKHYKIRPYELFYEDFENSENWETTIRGVVDYLEIEYTFPFDFSDIKRMKQGIAEKPVSYHEILSEVKRDQSNFTFYKVGNHE